MTQTVNKTYPIISIALLISSLAILAITAKVLDNSEYFYGVFISLAFMVAVWIIIGLSFISKKKKDTAEVKN